jgi:hypothetical protein
MKMAENSTPPSAYANALKSMNMSEFNSGARPLDVMPGQPGVDFGGRIPNKVPGPAVNMEQVYADMLKKSSAAQRPQAPLGFSQIQAPQPVAQTPSGKYGESMYWKRMSDEDKLADFMRSNPFGGMAPFFGVSPQYNETFDQFRGRVGPMYSRLPGKKDPFAYLDQPMWG